MKKINIMISIIILINLSLAINQNSLTHFEIKDKNNLSINYSYNNNKIIKSIELISQRTSNSKTIKNPDGSYSYEGTIGELYYKDRNGNWNEINNSILLSKSGYDFENTKNRFQSFFMKDSKKDNLVKFQIDNNYVTFSFKNNELGKVNNVEGYFKGNVFIYPNVYNGINIKYSISSRQLLEEFVVSSPKIIENITNITQKINFKNVNFNKNLDGSIDFLDISTREIVWTFPKPVMYEQSNPNIRNYGIHYVITKERNNFFLIKIIDQEGKEWLLNPNRNYPVIIDATIDKQVGTATDDCREFVDGNCDCNSAMAVLGHYLGTDDHVGFRFSTVTIPRGSTIISAKLEVRAGNTKSYNMLTNVFAEDVDNSSTFACTTNPTTGSPRYRTATTNYVAWDVISTTWTQGLWYNSTDFSSIVEEVTNRTGWVSGNGLTILIRDNSSGSGYEYKRVSMYDENLTYAAKLHISYTPPLCSPITNENWSISNAQQCNGKSVDLGTGKIIINSGGTLTLTGNSNLTARGLELNRQGDSIFIHQGSKLIIT